jgi:hypothetical protein
MAEPQPLAGGGAAQHALGKESEPGQPLGSSPSDLVHGVRLPAIAGVVIRNGAMTNSTERVAPPEPYQETPGEPVEAMEEEEEEAINDAPEEIIAPAPFVAPPYTEAEVY